MLIRSPSTASSVANSASSASVRWRHAVRWATMSRSCGSSTAMCASVASSTPGAVVNAGACTAACTSAAVTRRIRRAAGSRRWPRMTADAGPPPSAPAPTTSRTTGIRGGTQREQRRLDPMHLVAQPVRQSTHIGRQGRLHVHELTQLDLVLALNAQFPTRCPPRSTSAGRRSTTGAWRAVPERHSRRGGRALASLRLASETLFGKGTSARAGNRRLEA